MKPLDLQSIIERKNEKLEYAIINEAERIIEQIIVEQSHMIGAQKNIDDLREQLKKLEIPQLDSSRILG